MATRYAVNLYRRDGPILQIRRNYDPVPVHPEEKSEHRRYIVDRISSMISGWEWNGPAIPDVKAPFKAFLAGQRGRIWVQLHRPGRRLDDEPTVAPRRAVPPRWTEPVVYDVFEPDGRCLGQLHAPDGFRVFPEPVLRRDTASAVVEGPMGVDYVARYVLKVPS